MVLLLSKDKYVLGKSTPTGIDDPKTIFNSGQLRSRSHSNQEDVASNLPAEVKKQTRNIMEAVLSNETAINLNARRSPVNFDANQITVDNPLNGLPDPYVDYLCSNSIAFKSYHHKSRPLSAASSKYRLVKHSNLYPNRQTRQPKEMHTPSFNEYQPLEVKQAHTSSFNSML